MLDNLREYWIIIGMEEILPYNLALEKDKKRVMNTFGFQHYSLYIALQEVKKEIYSSLPKWIYRLLGGLKDAG